MIAARQRALDDIRAGDIIFAIGAGGQPKLLLVHHTDADRISTRQITTQIELEFGRDGLSRRSWDGGTCTIVSTARLPADEFQVALGLDRKMKNGKEPADFRLSRAEIDLLLKADRFFKARPLPTA